ncbi:MAG: non-ribosomal peptide synthetase, partial [bacterium]|nr:non-ribosomal peptide synthetase [bacterium]
KISETVLTPRENEDGEKYLCAYYVASVNIETTELRNFLLETLPDYMIPSYFKWLEKMPLTPGGKTDRNALPEPAALHTQQHYTPPRNDTEKKLTRIWADTLKIETKEIGIDNDFFQMGGHSLRATIIVSKIHKQFNIKLPLAEIFKKTTIRTLAETIKELTRHSRDKYVAIEPTEKKEYYSLSSAQKRLFILQQMELQNTAYNMPHTIPLDKNTDPLKLEEAFKKIIQRHESLRTSFHMLNPVTPGRADPVTPGRADPVTQSPITDNSFSPVQVVHDTVEFNIEYYNLQAHQDSNIVGLSRYNDVREAFFRPFELSKAPLLRVAVIEIAHNTDSIKEKFMLVDMHHIITDGMSQEILTKEFSALYADENLPLLELQYRDYTEWQSSSKQKELKKQQEEYWTNLFSGELPVLTLPTDFTRPVIQSFEGDNISFVLNKKETANLKETAKENETTLYMTILSIFTLLLSKLSSQEDIIVGTPTAGRRHADLENIIGMFVNTLAMRNYPHGEKSIQAFLREVKENTLNTFENQDYQFEDLVDRLSVRRDTGRNPLFDVMFNLLNQAEYKEHDTNTTPVNSNSNNSNNSFSSSNSPNSQNSQNSFTTSKFDLTLSGFEAGDSLYFHFEYSVKLFKEETIKRFITYFEGILPVISNEPGQKISEIEIITEEEKKQILYEFNDTAADYPKDKTIHQLFEEQVEKTPDNTATVGNG